MNGTDTFLDINNAHLRVNSGNVHASAFILDQIDFIASSNASTTVGFNNATTAFLAASNIEVGTANLFVDTTTSNVGIGTNAPLDTLHVKGGTLIDGDLTVNGTISTPSTSLQGVTDTGNVTSNTVQFSNAITSLTATSNIEVAGFVGSSGTGALTVPNGTTGQRPVTTATGMLRYNSTTGFMEAYSAVGWAPIAQPPTVTGISPLTTLRDGSASRTLAHQYNIVTPDGGGGFGNPSGSRSVAMSTDGTYAIVGARLDETGGQPNNSGSAHIFIKNGNTWTHQQKLFHPSPGSDDYFGVSVAISGDGLWAVVGAHYDDTGGGVDAGSAQVFWRNGTSWSRVDELLHPSGSGNDNFGHSVDISRDGSYIVVGSYNDDHSGVAAAGSVQVYRKTSATGASSQWNHEQGLTSSATFTPTVSDWFGASVSISLDGYYIICGAPFREGSVGDREGKAVVFKRASGATSFTFQQTLTHPTPQAYDEFGRTVSLSSDGTYALIGVPGDGSGGTWANGAGTGQVFVRNGSTWTHQAELVHPSPGAAGVTMAFGWSVSISGDGIYALIGAWEADVNGVSKAGSAQIFKRVGTSWTHQAHVLRPTPAVNDYAFSSVAMSSDGAYAIANGGGPTATASVEIFYNTPAPDTSTQVFTATGTGIVSGSTVQLEGADGTLYNVVDATPPNAAGTQVTFKMGSVGSGGVEFPPSAMSTNTSITGYVASASYNSSTAWKAFDDTTNYWETTTNSATHGYYQNTIPLLAGIHSATTQDISGTTHRGHWLQLQIPNPVVLSRAVIGAGGTGAAYQIGQFVILGSNDNINWTALHAGDNTSAASASAPYSLSLNVTTLSAGSTEAFSYFRVVIKSKGTPYNFDIQLQNIQFFSGSGSWDLAQQPYKVKVNSTSGLIGTSTAKIGFLPTWTTAADANLGFGTSHSTTQTLVGTDGGGGTNRKFTVVSTGVNALPSGLTAVESGTDAGVITGQIAADQEGVTTSVTFRLTDIGSELFTDRAINIVGVSSLYTFTSHTFTNAGATGRLGPTFADMKSHYSSTVWEQNPAWFKLGAPSPSPTTYPSRLNGFQLWTVPASATYKIIAKGARGGSSTGSEDGYGGQIEARFTLTKGTKIIIVVGQKGAQPGSSSGGGGGGGATFILKDNFSVSSNYPYMGTDLSDIYMIVGGGGGGTSDNHSTNGRAGDAEMYSSGGAIGGSGASTYGGGGGTGYTSTGGGMSSGSRSSGGGGLSSTTQFFGFPGGESWTSTQYGSAGSQDGGFGGGGAAVNHEGGAGGGYQGGSCGSYTSTNPDAGGHTFVSSTATYTGSHTTHTDQHGSVQITKM